MVFSRAIPCLLLHKKGLVKTVRFKTPRYIGDPLNAIRIFNEKEVDELMLLDIDATVEGREPDYALIEDIASECFMPLCYGGGVRTIEQMKRIYALGVEKISLGSAAAEAPEIVARAAKVFGSQSVTVTMDVKKFMFGGHRVTTRNATRKSRYTPVAFAKLMEAQGAGELVVNAVDRDGMMAGYDLELLREIADAVSIPVIALGGAGKLEDLKAAVTAAGVSAAAAGSLFVYYGPLKGVLINYPPYEALRELFSDAQGGGDA